MKKVVVTGAQGFIGRHTLKNLRDRNFEIHAIVSENAPDINLKNCHWHLANLLDINQIKQLFEQIKPTHFLHFAWCYSMPGKYWQAEDNFLWVQASLEMLKQFQAQGGQRVVMSGTCAEYDWNYGYCSEFLTPKNPSSPYGICKNALQEMLQSYAKLTNLSSAWGRIFLPYGPYEYVDRLVPSVICSLLKGEPARCSHGRQMRDFLYVQDVAGAFVALLESDVTGPVNIGSGQPIAIKDIVYKIGEQMGRPDLIQLGAIPAATNDTPLVIADVKRLSDEVGFQPTYNLERGIEETINWWRSDRSQEGK
ncbi:NAD-dependent epimerase/dehydratase family protein [Planktothrix agardhii]|uniref:NAD-dependent epimerase/dehydratase family protein n=1 Tax=Planktothrix agardhii TaxID=1160 RepID=UPI0020B31572|nr:NAD(P)-dependent oxidoreductase [Planktothrix agardhii]CAD5945991.1 dTDP-glucose 4,6-dehydratase [Planktothrix agardhii]